MKSNEEEIIYIYLWYVKNLPENLAVTVMIPSDVGLDSEGGWERIWGFGVGFPTRKCWSCELPGREPSIPMLRGMIPCRERIAEPL